MSPASEFVFHTLDTKGPMEVQKYQCMLWRLLLLLLFGFYLFVCLVFFYVTINWKYFVEENKDLGS